MRNVRILVAYDGSTFFGWQRQDGFESVQEALEEAVLGATGQSVVVHGAGRTDTGVHALGMVASFHVDTGLDDDRLRHAVNAHLPASVVVRRLESCPDDFHPRFDASGKRYLYLCLCARFRPPFLREHAHWIRTPLDAGRMRRAAKLLEGRHDFAAFGNAGSVRKTTVRCVRRVRLIARRERFALIVDGDGFLYNMVRTIAGTLIAVGEGRMSVEGVASALASRQRARAGPTAPARGLYLLRVNYPEPIFEGPVEGRFPRPGLFPV